MVTIEVKKLLAKLLALHVLILAGLPLYADEVPERASLGKEAYLTPPREIVEAVLAPRHENRTLTNLSPDGKKFLIARSDGLPSLQRLACPCVYLGETAFDPSAYRARDLWVRSVAGYELFYFAENRTVPVQVPDRARVSNATWSPDGSKLAFYAHFVDATHICIADTETGFTRRLTSIPVLATLVTSFQWSKDGKHIQTVLLPDDGKREMPKRNTVAAEPKVRVARGGPNPSRTFRFLLESPYDMTLLEHLATGQLSLIDISDGHVTKIGFPNLFQNVSMAPGKEQFRVSMMKRPFSYFVPMARFGSSEGIWDQEGKSLSTLAERSLREVEPPAPTVLTTGQGQNAGQGGKKGGGTGAKAKVQPPQADPDDPKGPAEPVDPDAKRLIAWRPDGAGLSFLQLRPLSGKGAAKAADDKTPRQDRVWQWLPPFGKEDVKVIYETPLRILAAQYSEDCQWLFLTQTVDKQRQISAVDLADPQKTLYVLHKGLADKEMPDIKKAPDAPAAKAAEDDEQQAKKAGGGLTGPAPASLLTRSSGGAVQVVRISSAGEVFLNGTERARTGAKAPAKVFLDKINIKTGQSERIYQSKGDMLESIDTVDGNDVRQVFTTRQNKNVVPDSFQTDLKTGKVTRLTNNVDPTPWYRQVREQRFQVTRIDGFKFWVKVTTGPTANGKLPALFWIYPKEYASQTAYNTATARLADNAHRFVTPDPRSMTILTLLGYAVVEPDVPIVGPAGRMNDNYIPDLRNSLWAAIDELDKKGIIDRDRLAIGGHSYGAFSTANALAHTPFFKAGIAGDGNYNRTLTSMTFQTEKRQLWEARETYLEMSPLLWANRVNGALLMYHGMDDANVGTNPINAEHMFMALDGLGKPAALYMYPYEGHGPIAKETTLDLWARWTGWLDTYVMNPKSPGKAGAAKAAADEESR